MGPDRDEEIDSTRRSWDRATRQHNAHKGDQAAAIKKNELLFPEEIALLGAIEGKEVVHLQCNAGQDSLCLAKRKARVTGVDFSGEAVAFARGLSRDSGIEARFIEAEVVEWMRTTDERFDIAFASYGVIGWHPSVDAWMSGAARVLEPGGRLVYVEFHPLIWSLGQDAQLSGDDYFTKGPYIEPVGDYVADSGTSLGAEKRAVVTPNDVPAYGYQHTLGEIASSAAKAGLRIERLEEYPHSNGYRPGPTFVAAEGRRWVWPVGRARIPLMFGLSAVKV